jgi:coronin-1B/1C/6
MRAYKTVNDSYIEPISFVVPRRAEVFQADIYPPATGIKPGVSAADWLDGKSALPPKIDLESIYEGNDPVEVAADFKPPQATPAPTPAKAPSPIKKEPEPVPAPVMRSVPPSMSEQKGSIAAMASKFQDDEEEGDDAEEDPEETSRFEEIPKPTIRPTSTTKPEAKPTSPTTVRASAPMPVSQATARSTETPAETKPTTIPTSSGPISAIGLPPPTTTSSSGNVEASLAQITKMLEQQTKTIEAQSEKIGNLTAEVDFLKTKVGSSGGASQDQSARIRQLELELEAARS